MILSLFAQAFPSAPGPLKWPAATWFPAWHQSDAGVGDLVGDQGRGGKGKPL